MLNTLGRSGLPLSIEFEGVLGYKITPFWLCGDSPHDTYQDNTMIQSIPSYGSEWNLEDIACIVGQTVAFGFYFNITERSIIRVGIARK